MPRAYLTKLRSDSRRSVRAAIREIVVLSPPGMIRASHCCKSTVVRTSVKKKTTSVYVEVWVNSAAALLSRVICSRKAPCKAKTPIVNCISQQLKIFGELRFKTEQFLAVKVSRTSNCEDVVKAMASKPHAKFSIDSEKFLWRRPAITSSCRALRLSHRA